MEPSFYITHCMIGGRLVMVHTHETLEEANRIMERYRDIGHKWTAYTRIFQTGPNNHKAEWSR